MPVSPGATNHPTYSNSERIEREAEFERIRQSIYRMAEVERLEKLNKIERAKEQERWLESQKEYLR